MKKDVIIIIYWKVLTWCNDNKITVNCNKTKDLPLATYQQYHTLPVKEITFMVYFQDMYTVVLEISCRLQTCILSNEGI